MYCSLPGSSIHGIFQARILEWVTISFSRRSSRTRVWTRVSCIVDRRFTVWATREVSIKPPVLLTQSNKMPNKWKMSVLFIPGKATWGLKLKGTRNAHQEITWDQIKWLQALQTLYQQVHPWTFARKLNKTLSGWDTKSPFAWQSSSALLSYLAQSPVLEIQFGSSAHRPSSWQQTRPRD